MQGDSWETAAPRAVTEAELLALLGDWASGADQLYRALSMALRGLIERGDLAPGALLPPERRLARSLNVSRGTVMSAYLSLRDDRLLESRQGSGTRVRIDAPRPLLPGVDLLAAPVPARSLSGRLFQDNPDVVDLAVSLLHDADAVRHLSLGRQWSDLEAVTQGHGYAPLGLVSLREAIGGYYRARGLRTTSAEVLVTNGAQQAIDLCAGLALRPGDAVIVESPTYPGAIDAFARYGARLVPLPFSSHRERPELLRERVEKFAPRLVYLMPGMHNPTGQALSDSRRRDIARLAEQHSLYVVEDNTLADTQFLPADRPLLAAYSSNDRVLTIGSLSKSAWGGLRIGWIRGEKELVQRLGRTKAARDLSLSPLPQMLAAAVLDDLDRVLEHRRDQLSRRARYLQEMLAERLPAWNVAAPDGGLSLWVEIPHGDADEFAALALRHGVAVMSGRAHCVDGSGAQHLRLAYSPTEAALDTGSRRLSSAWAEYTQTLQTHPGVIRMPSRHSA